MKTADDHSLVEGIDRSDVHELLIEIPQRSVPQGDVLFQAGDIGDELVLVPSGTLRASIEQAGEFLPLATSWWWSGNRGCSTLRCRQHHPSSTPDEPRRRPSTVSMFSNAGLKRMSYALFGDTRVIDLPTPLAVIVSDLVSGAGVTLTGVSCVIFHVDRRQEAERALPVAIPWLVPRDSTG